MHGRQKEVAKAVGIAPQFLNDILKGRSKCPVNTAKKLEAHTGINIRVWLYGGETKIAGAWLDYIKRVTR